MVLLHIKSIQFSKHQVASYVTTCYSVTVVSQLFSYLSPQLKLRFRMRKWTGGLRNNAYAQNQVTQKIIYIELTRLTSTAVLLLQCYGLWLTQQCAIVIHRYSIHCTDKLTMYQAPVVLSIMLTHIPFHTLTHCPSFGNPSHSVFLFSCQGWLTFSLLTHTASSFLHISLTTEHDLAITQSDMNVKCVYTQNESHLEYYETHIHVCLFIVVLSSFPSPSLTFTITTECLTLILLLKCVHTTTVHKDAHVHFLPSLFVLYTQWKQHYSNLCCNDTTSQWRSLRSWT